MGNISDIMGGPWSPPKEFEPDPPELQLRDAMASAGITAPAELQLDGKLHRFRSGTKGTPGKGDKSGWYVAYSDGIPAGRFGCWRAGIEVTWRADVGRQLTDAEQIIHARRLSEAIKIRDDELKRQREAVADTAELIWVKGMLADADHPYLARKGVQSHGVRVTGDGRLMVPLYTPEGKISSIQYIDTDGGKLYHAGGQTGGCFWMVGTMDEPGVLYIAEGFATAATIHEITNRPCVVGFSASNLVPVTGSMREKYGPTQELVIVADNDASGTGQKYADQASAKYGARVVMPPIDGDANDYVQAGHDLKILLQPQASDWLVPATTLMKDQAPPKWIIKGWLEQHCLCMVHGPSGAGKSFVVLDWCLHIAAGLPDWNGAKVSRSGNVIYLAGEGHYGIRRRLAAWQAHHKAKNIDMWVSRSGCDLNTAEGYQKVLDSIRSLPDGPTIIVIDTLHRFMDGDENSAQDAKTMIDACDALKNEFNCTVILVHHTGVSDEAQHRARGSSAWKGALDEEYSVIPSKADQPLKIVNRKMKDGEPDHFMHAELTEVVIPGWKDEDGEPVKSVILVPADAPAERKKESKLDGHRKLFEGAWWASGAEVVDDMPYISRSALLNHVINKLQISEASAKQYVKPSVQDKLVGALTIAEIIEPKDHGWAVICPVTASALIMAKNSS